MEDPRDIVACTHLLFIGKHFEQMGDLAANIAESVVYSVEGARIEGGPKGGGRSARGRASEGRNDGSGAKPQSCSSTRRSAAAMRSTPGR